MKGGAATGPSPVDRGKTGSKHHVIVEAYGIPLATILTGGNRHDVTHLVPLIEAVPPIRGKRGRPQHLYTDRGYRPRLPPRGLSRPGPRRADHSAYRPARHLTRIRPRRLPRGREGAVALLRWFRRPRIRRGDPRRHPPGVSSPSAAPSSAGDACAHPSARRRHEHFAPFGLTFSGVQR